MLTPSGRRLAGARKDTGGGEPLRLAPRSSACGLARKPQPREHGIEEERRGARKRVPPVRLPELRPLDAARLLVARRRAAAALPVLKRLYEGPHHLGPLDPRLRLRVVMPVLARPAEVI